MSESSTRPGKPEAARSQGWSGQARRTRFIVAATCLPAIAGTTIMSALAWCQQANVPDYSLLGAFFGLSFIPAYAGAVYGPILIPVGGAALGLAWRRGIGGIRWSWLWIAGALVATAVWWRWTIYAVELP